MKTNGGNVQIVDSTTFQAASTRAAGLVKIEPGGMQEMHWHPIAEEWEYYNEGRAQMGIVASEGEYSNEIISK